MISAEAANTADKTVTQNQILVCTASLPKCLAQAREATRHASPRITGGPGQVRESRAARLGEVLPSLALRQLHQHVRASRIGAESLDQPGEGIAARPTAALAFDADDVQGKLAKRA
jgi:hypothetical protein